MKIFSENRRAAFDYEILEKLEAGIELKGSEVKSITSGQVHLAGAYAVIKGNEIWLINLEIPPYQPLNINTSKNYDPSRNRRLLLHKKEIKSLIGKIKEKGLTLVPLKLYNKKNKIKVEIGLGKSRKKYNKRELIKKREVEKEIRRKLKTDI